MLQLQHLTVTLAAARHSLTWECTPDCKIWNSQCYSCNAEFVVSFCTLVSENLR